MCLNRCCRMRVYIAICRAKVETHFQEASKSGTTSNQVKGGPAAISRSEKSCTEERTSAHMIDQRSFEEKEQAKEDDNQSIGNRLSAIEDRIKRIENMMSEVFDETRSKRKLSATANSIIRIGSGGDEEESAIVANEVSLTDERISVDFRLDKACTMEPLKKEDQLSVRARIAQYEYKQLDSRNRIW